MTKKLLLVDLENKHKVDLSPLDESFRAIIFVGANQSPPKAAKKPATAHRFSRVDFLKISGAGKNALDFHIAFELGRTIETAPDTECFVLSGDKGFDPLLNHLNASGMSCRRVENIAELVPATVVPLVAHYQLCARSARGPARLSTTEVTGAATVEGSPRRQIRAFCRQTRRATGSLNATDTRTTLSTPNAAGATSELT